MKTLLSLNSLKFASMLVPVLAASLLSACNSGGVEGTVPSTAVNTTGQTSGPPGGATETNSPSGNGTPSGTPTTGAPAVGESCVSGDSNKICLAMHFVTYQNTSGAAVASTDQAATIIHTMNQLWSQCNIGFQIEKYEAVDPTKLGLVYGAQSQNQLDQIRQTFSAPSDELLAVTTGPWGTAVNAWTNMPGDNLYGAVMEASIVGYGGGIIYAHEFGHYLGLDHVSDSSDLMDAIIYTTSTKIDSTQCQSARATVAQYWTAMIRK